MYYLFLLLQKNEKRKGSNTLQRTIQSTMGQSGSKSDAPPTLARAPTSTAVRFDRAAAAHLVETQVGALIFFCLFVSSNRTLIRNVVSFLSLLFDLCACVSVCMCVRQHCGAPPTDVRVPRLRLLCNLRPRSQAFWRAGALNFFCFLCFSVLFMMICLCSNSSSGNCTPSERSLRAARTLRAKCSQPKSLTVRCISIAWLAFYFFAYFCIFLL